MSSTNWNQWERGRTWSWVWVLWIWKELRGQSRETGEYDQNTLYACMKRWRINKNIVFLKNVMQGPARQVSGVKVRTVKLNHLIQVPGLVEWENKLCSLTSKDTVSWAHVSMHMLKNKPALIKVLMSVGRECHSIHPDKQFVYAKFSFHFCVANLSILLPFSKT